jgi:hypothetical protein
MTDTTDPWSTRFPAAHTIGELTAAELAQWRADAREYEHEHNYITPWTITPKPFKPVEVAGHSRTTGAPPSSDWARTSNPHAKVGVRSGWQPFKE